MVPQVLMLHNCQNNYSIGDVRLSREPAAGVTMLHILVIQDYISRG
jgi:hypothetical protein